MAIHGRTDDMRANRERRERENALQEAIPFVIQHMAEDGQMATPDIVRFAALFEKWDDNCANEEGCIRRCPIDGLLYKCIRTPSKAARSSKRPPSEATQNWEIISVSEG